MITILASAVVTPFMMAAPADNAAATQPETIAAVYNWSTQNAQNASDEDFSAGATGSFSQAPGCPTGPHSVDDWYMC